MIKVEMTTKGYIELTSCPEHVANFILNHCGRYCKVCVNGHTVTYWGDMGDLYWMMFKLSQNYGFKIKR